MIKLNQFNMKGKFEFLNDTTVKYGSDSNPNITYIKTFKKGDVIEGSSIKGNDSVILTNGDGSMPNLLLIGSMWLKIPISELKQVADDSPVKISPETDINGLAEKVLIFGALAMVVFGSYLILTHEKK